MPVELSPKTPPRVLPMTNSGVASKVSLKISYKNSIIISFRNLSKDAIKNNSSKDSWRNFPIFFFKNFLNVSSKNPFKNFSNDLFRNSHLSSYYFENSSRNGFQVLLLEFLQGFIHKEFFQEFLQYFSEDYTIHFLEKSLRIPVELCTWTISRIPPMIGSRKTFKDSFKNFCKNSITSFQNLVLYKDSIKNNFKNCSFEEILQRFFLRTPTIIILRIPPKAF